MKSGILLNRGCKHEQTIEFQTPDLQGEEKGGKPFSPSLLHSTVADLSQVLGTTGGLFPSRLRDCNLPQAEQGPSLFSCKNYPCTPWKKNCPSVQCYLALIPQKDRRNLALESGWFATQVKCSLVSCAFWKTHLALSGHKPQPCTRADTHNLRLQLGECSLLPHEAWGTCASRPWQTPGLLGRVPGPPLRAPG